MRVWEREAGKIENRKENERKKHHKNSSSKISSNFSSFCVLQNFLRFYWRTKRANRIPTWKSRANLWRQSGGTGPAATESWRRRWRHRWTVQWNHWNQQSRYILIIWLGQVELHCVWLDHEKSHGKPILTNTSEWWELLGNKSSIHGFPKWSLVELSPDLNCRPIPVEVTINRKREQERERERERERWKQTTVKLRGER